MVSIHSIVGNQHQHKYAQIIKPIYGLSSLTGMLLIIIMLLFIFIYLSNNIYNRTISTETIDALNINNNHKTFAEWKWVILSIKGFVI